MCLIPSWWYCCEGIVAPLKPLYLTEVGLGRQVMLTLAPAQDLCLLVSSCYQG